MTAPPSKDQLQPVDWVRIEPHYIAGIRSVSSISKEFGVTRRAIDKHAAKHGWTRKLQYQIHAAADALVDRQTAQDMLVAPPRATQAVAGQVAGPEIRATSDAEVVAVNAAVIATLRFEHRALIGTSRAIVKGLLAELQEVQARPDLYALVHDALSDPSETAVQALRDMATFVQSLPNRTVTAARLLEALRTLVGMEREAYGLNTSEAGQRHLVVIKDYTGKGDADAPPMPVEDL